MDGFCIEMKGSKGPAAPGREGGGRHTRRTDWRLDEAGTALLLLTVEEAAARLLLPTRSRERRTRRPARPPRRSSRRPFAVRAIRRSERGEYVSWLLFCWGLLVLSGRAFRVAGSIQPEAISWLRAHITS